MPGETDTDDMDAAQAPMPMPNAALAQPPRAPSMFRTPSMIIRLVVGCILLGVGLGFGLYGGLTFSGRFANPLSAPYQSGQFSQHLQTGRYLVYAAPVSTVHETPGQLTVSSPSGSPVPVSAFTGDQTQTRSGTTYDAFAQFQASAAGVYHLSLAANGPPRIIVAPTLLDAAKSLIRPAVETVAGGLVALIGATMLLRAFTRRWWRLQDTRALWNPGGAEPGRGGWTPPPPPPVQAWHTPPRPPIAQPWDAPRPPALSEPPSPPPGGFS